jgi:ribonuclease G
MPLSTQRSVSRKISDVKLEKALQKKVNQILPAEAGYIIRTEAALASEAEFENEVTALWSRWEELFRQRVTTKAPKLLTRTASTIQRAILDHLNDQTEFVKVNQAELFMNLRAFTNQMGLENLSNKFQLVEDPLMFEKIGIEKTIKNLTQREVTLPSGGFLIIDETEAMTMIDVNSGKNRSGYSQRELALATNVEAAIESARQIKLRNLGGIILIDFIDMDHGSDRQEVLKAFKQQAFKDRVGINVMGFTALGILEMTRKKAGKRLSDFLKGECHCCHGLNDNSLDKVTDELLKDILRKYKHNPAELMCYQIDQHLAAHLDSLNTQINLWLSEVTSDIEYEILPFLSGGFKMTYMGRRK